jgi:Domain of Unknown Function (DUF1080)
MKIPAAWLALACSIPLAAAEWTPLFNGRDLTGWVPVNVAPNTFTVRDQMIVSTGKPTGVMRTDRQYENFEMELEWKHIVPGGNAGLFVWSDPITSPGVPFARAIEVQVLDGRNTATYTSHGDIFAIHGAKMTPDRPHPQGWDRCLPSEHRAKPAGEWNHYRVICRDGALKLAVNGKEVSGGTKSWPRKGYICLEAEGSECHFRNLRIKELPSTGATAAETAPLAEGFVSIYNGLNFDGWRTSPEHLAHWKSEDWIIDYDGKCGAEDPHLWTKKSYRDFVMICDWRWKEKGGKTRLPVILATGEYGQNADGSQQTEEVIDAGDSGIYLRGNDKSQVNIWCWPSGSGEVYGYRTDPAMPASVKAGVTPRSKADKPIGEWNRFIITMKWDRLSVVLNGQTVIENAALPGVPREGPLALQHHGSPIQFANIYIKEL